MSLKFISPFKSYLYRYSLFTIMFIILCYSSSLAQSITNDSSTTPINLGISINEFLDSNEDEILRHRESTIFFDNKNHVVNEYRVAKRILNYDLLKQYYFVSSKLSKIVLYTTPYNLLGRYYFDIYYKRQEKYDTILALKIKTLGDELLQLLSVKYGNPKTLKSINNWVTVTYIKDNGLKLDPFYDFSLPKEKIKVYVDKFEYKYEWNLSNQTISLDYDYKNLNITYESDDYLNILKKIQKEKQKEEDKTLKNTMNEL